MVGIITALAGIATSIFGGGGGSPLIPDNINVEIDIWEKNKVLFILIFLLIVMIVIVRL